MNNQNQQSPEDQQFDPMSGVMRISKADKVETLRLQQFIVQPKGVMLNEIMLEVDYNTSTFAIAAMMKGLQEFYFKPAGLAGAADILEMSEENLKIWEEICQKAKQATSSIIDPNAGMKSSSGLILPP